jgi:geranylgeranyl reductase family protein
MNATPARDALRADVVILGAGPAGIATAIRLAQRGVDDVLLLDAVAFPRHKTCGSGLSPRGIQTLRQLGLWERIEPLTYRIDGMRLTTPGGHKVDLPAKGVEAVVCQRHDLDQALLEEALNLGVRFVSGFRASELIERHGRVRGAKAQDGREAIGGYTVVATGAHAPLAVETGEKRAISTIMGWWENLPFRDNWLEMIYDAEIIPWYGWMFPETPTRANIGITYVDGAEKRNARKLFEGFLDRHFKDRLQSATRIGNYRGHPIVYTYALPKLWSPGRVVVGEAGRLTHPATGEGISQGMRSGIFAADALADVLTGGSATLAMYKYQAQCSAAFVPSFLAGGAFLKLATQPVLDTVGSWSTDPRLGAVTRTMFSKI